MFRFNITGGPELSAALRELGDLTSDRRAVTAIKDGMVNASAPMVDAANKHAPSDNSGSDRIQVLASKTLTARQRKESRKASKDRILTYVGERGGSNVGLQNEFGTVDRIQTSSGKSVGRLTPHPFMRPAFDSTARQVLDGIVPAVAVVVQKRAKAAARRAAKKAGGK
jgi:hypothetical protein